VRDTTLKEGEGKNFFLAPVLKVHRQCPLVLLVEVRRGADKSLAFPICSTRTRIFLGWVKEVRTTKSSVCMELRGEYVE
jgi:hypothetical protein